MFYEPSTSTTFNDISQFLLAHRYTSFGDLNSEEERNAAGLYLIQDVKPEYNPDTHRLTPGVPVFANNKVTRTWTKEQFPVETIKDNLKAKATALRWETETGGVDLPGGIRVGSTTQDQNRITSVIANAHLAGLTSVDFKAESGWVTLTLEQLEGMCAAIALHVQRCFSVERLHHDTIDALETVEQLEAHDINFGWVA